MDIKEAEAAADRRTKAIILANIVLLTKQAQEDGNSVMIQWGLKRLKIKAKELEDVQLTDEEANIYDEVALKFQGYRQQIKEHGKIVKTIRNADDKEKVC